MYAPQQKYFNALLHTLVWVLVSIILLMYPTWSNPGASLPSDFTIKQVVHLVCMLAAYYLNAFILAPNLLFRNKYFLYITSLAAVVAVFSLLLARVDTRLELAFKMQHIWGEKRNPNSTFDRFGFFTTLITLGISTSITAIARLNRNNRDRLRFERERIATELSFLKAQIHPHFFFNTLNTIYSLSFIDAESSRSVLTKLSKMMRYMLYETQQNASTLDKELSLIQNYVEIMKHRLNSNTTVVLNIPVAVTYMPIAPLILLPYVENVFKHGVDDKKRGVLMITIDQHKKGIRLHTLNKIAPSPSIEEKHTGGIGMRNAQRRLNLVYKNKFQILTRIIPETNEFELTLQLDLL